MDCYSSRVVGLTNNRRGRCDFGGVNMTTINKQWLQLISSGRASSLKMDIKADEAVMEVVGEQYHQTHQEVSSRSVHKRRLVDIVVFLK